MREPPLAVLGSRAAWLRTTSGKVLRERDASPPPPPGGGAGPPPGGRGGGGGGMQEKKGHEKQLEIWRGFQTNGESTDSTHNRTHEPDTQRHRWTDTGACMLHAESGKKTMKLPYLATLA